MNAFARIEYVALRVARRFLFNERLANRLGRWLPYYRSSVNETNPGAIVSAYLAEAACADIDLASSRILEVGAGRTNAVGYGLAAAGAAHVTVLEPFVPYDAAADRHLFERHFNGTDRLKDSTTRVTGFGDIATGSIDLILSNSVLEHVSDLGRFFDDCRRCLAPGGRMLHLVDYRDHFFKYPYGFLTFTRATWSKWLDPGDLPRWRIDDHLSAMQDAGFRMRILREDSLSFEFSRVVGNLDPEFDPERRPRVAVTFASIEASVT